MLFTDFLLVIIAELLDLLFDILRTAIGIA